MPFEKFEEIPTYEIDLSSGQNMDDFCNLFREALVKFGLAGKNYVFSGFNGDDIGRLTSAKEWSTKEKQVVFVNGEESISNDAAQDENPLYYALDYENAAIAVYDPIKLGPAETIGSREIIDESALLAILLIKT